VELLQIETPELDHGNFTFTINPLNITMEGEDETIRHYNDSKRDNSCNQQTVIAAIKVLKFRRLCTHDDVVDHRIKVKVRVTVKT